MKYSILLMLSLFIAACGSQAPTENIDQKANIKTSAESMGQMLLKKDFKGFVKYTHPKVIEMMGGELGMIQVLESSSTEMETSGSKFLNVTYGEPSATITSGNELQCTVPQTTEIQVEEGIMVSKSTLIAVSTDNGKSWRFMDTSGQDIQTLKQSIPNLSEQLVIPPPQEAVMK